LEEPTVDVQEAGKTIEAALDLPIRYIDRSRAYYLALGYDNPYRWAHNPDVPFAAFSKPLAQSRVALVTTAAPFKPDAGDQGPWAPYNAADKFTEVYSMPIHPPPDLRISHVGYDRKHTSAEDINSYFPLQRLKEVASDGRMGELNSRFYAVPTLRSQRLTTERDAPQILAMCREDGIDAAVLVPT
jgi:D-proline reductase (dithiol) PrdB